ncbi:D-amino acid dehydrogenase 3 small subunit [Paraburkholderia piptadeniae]|uniref:D-amino acid dehydrogenase 3 small subunit n=1 Tax=Paraburkholderia piptadeniae TaxID=1701573 RepID=A0A1N7RW28_9BURK|nr:D-amino acid dehydrogenase [Paraburkholderia piptadeniae]SIT39288.1 D-amino acid dehydrogenase 3 small subunit [Paraburkholderia piptadeniae]
MPHVIIIGAGITGVTTAYTLSELGYQVTVIDRHRYPAMETSFANGGQLSACNAEVWNSTGTILKGLRWMLKQDAPVLFNPKPSWHKYSWIGEFISNIAHYRDNTIETVRLAIEARNHLFAIAEREQIDFDLQRRGILHFYHDRKSYDAATRTNELLVSGGLERFAVTPAEVKQIEPTLRGQYYGGYFTPSDSTGDIHRFTRGLASACERRGVRFRQGVTVESVECLQRGVRFLLSSDKTDQEVPARQSLEDVAGDAVVVCAGVGSRRIASLLGDRLNVYPVKGYSITVHLEDENSVSQAPWVSLLDESAKIVTSRLGAERLRIAGTAEFNGCNRDIRMDRIDPLIRWVNQNFTVNTSRVVPWSGLRPMMPNMMPRVMKGRAPRVFYNTGHGHLGWTLSAATAAAVGKVVWEHLPTDVN